MQLIYADIFGKIEDILNKIEKEIGLFLDDSQYNGLYFIVRNSWGKPLEIKAICIFPQSFYRSILSDWWHIDIK